jgi:hypothetical protein
MEQVLPTNPEHMSSPPVLSGVCVTRSLVLYVCFVDRCLSFCPDREVFATSGTYLWSFVTQIFHNGQPSHGGDRKMFEVMTSILPKGTLGSVASLLAATLHQELLTLPEHLSSPPVFSGVRVTRSLVLYVCCVDRCLSFCTFSFGHCVVCSSLIYTSILPKGTLGSVASLLAATLHQGNPDRNHKLWNIISFERYILHMQVLLECCYI